MDYPVPILASWIYNYPRLMNIVHNTVRDDIHADRPQQVQRRGDQRRHASCRSSTPRDVSTAPLRIGREIFALIQDRI